MKVIFVLALVIAASAASNIGCTSEFNPTCGLDGEEYNNPCWATLVTGGTQACAMKEVRSPDMCTNEWDPVCGTNGVQYPNACIADLITGGHQACSAANKRTVLCKCPRVYKPVCDQTNRNRYNNACIATDCNGVDPANLGEC